ncbi:MAG TPA: HEAT repeat domain-containing protein [Holophagaceae bacterium]
MSGFLELSQGMAMALKSLQMYTAAHPRTQEAVAASHAQLTALLAGQERMQFVASAGRAFVDGQVVEVRSPQLTALIRQVSERGLNGFRFERGVTPEEFLAFLQILILKPQRIEEQGGFEALLAAEGVRHIKVSQTRYEEVREGDGGEAREDRAPAFDAPPPPPAPAPTPSPDSLVKVIREALLAALGGAGDRPSGSGEAGGLQNFLPADLSGLGPLGYQLGLGEGMPTPVQLATLRQVLMSLTPERQLGLLAGLATLPAHPQGLALGVRALAGEMLAVATSSILGKGTTWTQLRGPLQEILRPLPDREALVRALAVHLRSMGQDASQVENLLRHLDWEHLSLEARLLKVLEEGHLFELSHEQRLAFLRELLDLRRFDDFLRVQDILLEVLRSDLVELRLKAVQTLAGIARWAADPGLPPEIEGPLAEALRAHFAWETDPPVHRWNTEGLEALLAALVQRGDLVHALADLSELQGLCEFQEEQAAWRNDALARLQGSLARPALLEAAAGQIFLRDRDQLAAEVYPYFQALGQPMALHLIGRLGGEQDRTRRGRLVEAVRSLGPAAIPPLMEALGSPAWYLVRNALTLLGDLGDAGSLPPVVPLLRHPEPRVRRTAVRALWKLGGPASEPHLVARLKDTDPETLQEVLFVLGQMRSEAALAPLSEMAQDRRAAERTRLQALDALAHIGSPKSIPILAELLRRKGFFGSAEPLSVRLAAARALSTLGDPEARAQLQRILDSEPKGEDREALHRAVTP